MFADCTNLALALVLSINMQCSSFMKTVLQQCHFLCVVRLAFLVHHLHDGYYCGHIVIVRRFRAYKQDDAKTGFSVSFLQLKHIYRQRCNFVISTIVAHDVDVSLCVPVFSSYHFYCHHFCCKLCVALRHPGIHCDVFVPIDMILRHVQLFSYMQ